jgi:hypothetical protein
VSAEAIDGVHERSVLREIEEELIVNGMDVRAGKTYK